MSGAGGATPICCAPRLTTSATTAPSWPPTPPAAGRLPSAAARRTRPGCRSASCSSTTRPATASSPRCGCWRSAAATCRARLFIEYLEPGSYYGLDISPDILLAAQDTIAEYGLAAKLPHLTLVKDLRLHFLPSGAFDFVHAHSVFSHSPAEVIDECFAHVGRVLAPGGFFDFTFDRTEGAEHQVLREDFYYRTQTLIDLAAKNGLEAVFMDDWEQTGHAQSKIRVTLPVISGPSAR